MDSSSGSEVWSSHLEGGHHAGVRMGGAGARQVAVRVREGQRATQHGQLVHAHRQHAAHAAARAAHAHHLGVPAAAAAVRQHVAQVQERVPAHATTM